MEAHYVEAGSMSIFWTQNRALKTTSLARVLIRTWWDPVGPSSFLRWDPNWASVGPGGSQLFSTWDPNRVRWDAVGPGGSQPFSTWDPTPRLGFTMLIRVRGGPMITIFTAL